MRSIRTVSCVVLLALSLVLLMNPFEVDSKVISKRGIMDNINEGLKFAGQFFNINTASDVANLVSRAFSQNSVSKNQETGVLGNLVESQNDVRESFNPVNLFTGVLRLLGLDSGKLGALAINGIIFIAQMIGNVLNNQRHAASASEEYTENDRFQDPKNPQDQDQSDYEQRKARSGSPIDWMLESPNERFSKLLNEARDENLPDNLAENLRSLDSNQGDTDCVKLLVCKSAPFIWGMQKAIGDRIDGSQSQNEQQERVAKQHEADRTSVFFKYLPSVADYQQNGRKCEKRYPKCRTVKISKGNSGNY